MSDPHLLKRRGFLPFNQIVYKMQKKWLNTDV